MSFMTAIPVAIKAAGMLKDGYVFVRDHPEEIQQAMDEATKAAVAAQKLVGNAADRLGVDDALSKAKRSASMAQSLVMAATSATKDESPEEAAIRKAEAEAAKAIDKARQVVLENADLRTTLPKLSERLGTSDAEKLTALMKVLDSPGIFAFCTYSRFDLDRDYTDYKGVFVDKAEVVGDGIATAISRAGNPDVYADIKYGQNVVIYVFNCPADELRYRCEALTEVLGAKNSYNLPIK